MINDKEIAEAVADAITDSMADYRAHINELKRTYLTLKVMERLLDLDDVDLDEAEIDSDNIDDIYKEYGWL